MNVNIISLAYLGDAVYELYIRKYLVNKGIYKSKDLHKESLNYITAKSQARIVNELMEKNIFSEEELDIIKRARNNKKSYHPQSTDIMTYKMSTGFEALIGYLYLNDKIKRIEEIMKLIEV